MPLEKMFKTRDISEEEFREVDFQTMGFAFEIHNEMEDFGTNKFIKMNWLIDVKKRVLIKLTQKCS